MSRTNVISFILMFKLVVTAFVAIAQSYDSPGGSYDLLRIENEVKLVVPYNQIDSVWQYINHRYSENSPFIKELRKSFHAVFAEEFFVDRYFDNEEMQLLKNNNGLRQRQRLILTDTSNRKHGRSLIQFKVNKVSDNVLNRGEYKYLAQEPDNFSEMLDNHPFLGFVAREHRYFITKRLFEYNINALSLFPTITIEQTRRRAYIFDGNKPFATLTLDDQKAIYKNDYSNFAEIELELNEVNYTLADSTLRMQMEGIMNVIKEDLLKKFPLIVQDQTPKYNKAAMALNIESLDDKDYFWDDDFAFYLMSFVAMLVVLYLIFMRNNIFRRKSNAT